MPKATPAPHVQRENLLVVPYVYAAILVGASVYQLVEFEDYLPRIVEHIPGNVQVIGTLVAAGLVGLQVFALPFLLRLNLSPLARGLSALCALVLPLAWLIVSLQAILRGVTLGPTDYLLAQPLDWIIIVEELLYLALAVSSFVILRGKQILRWQKK